VAVAGWQWDHWTEEIEAVRMVVVRVWQWQYWQSWGVFFLKKNVVVKNVWR
jgi:hypothetical protein